MKWIKHSNHARYKYSVKIKRKKNEEPFYTLHFEIEFQTPLSPQKFKGCLIEGPKLSFNNSVPFFCRQYLIEFREIINILYGILMAYNRIV